MSKNTKEKYYDFMLACYNAKQFDIKQMQLDYKVGTRICTLMRERGMILRRGEHTLWVGDEPSRTTAALITKECQRQTRLANAQHRVGATQLSIKPLKRVEYKAPVQQDLDVINHDRTNSKMLIILVVGAIIGFSIATLIWK
jgi:hypothetical protein